jgi:hypothetical protein
VYRKYITSIRKKQVFSIASIELKRKPSCHPNNIMKQAQQLQWGGVADKVYKGQAGNQTCNADGGISE